MSTFQSLASGFCRPSKHRYPLIDSYRGFVLLCMFFYHGCLFSKEYRLLNSTIPNTLSWVMFQKFIAGSFFFPRRRECFSLLCQIIEYKKIRFTLGSNCLLCNDRHLYQHGFVSE